MRAVSIAGGFTKFGNANRVKILRQKEEGRGYESIKVNFNRAMDGDSKEDILLKPGDMIIVSEGIF